MKRRVKDTPKIKTKDTSKLNEFKDFLELVNLTKDFQLPYKNPVIGELMKGTNGVNDVVAKRQEYIDASVYLLGQLDRVSGLCFKLLGKNSEDFDIEQDCFHIIIKYQTFYQNRELLIKLVYSTLALARLKGTLEKPQKRIIGSIQQPSLLVINDEGFTDDEAPQTTVFKGIDAKRIKACPNCSNYFWALPMKKKTCSPKCSNYLKQKERRENKEKRQKDNEKRRKTRQSKKEQVIAQKEAKERRKTNATL